MSLKVIWEPNFFLLHCRKSLVHMIAVSATRMTAAMKLSTITAVKYRSRRLEFVLAITSRPTSAMTTSGTITKSRL